MLLLTWGKVLTKAAVTGQHWCFFFFTDSGHHQFDPRDLIIFLPLLTLHNLPCLRTGDVESERKEDTLSFPASCV